MNDFSVKKNPGQHRATEKDVGEHHILDLYGVSTELLRDPDIFADLIRNSLNQGDLTPLYDPVLHAFEEGGKGLTGMVLLKSSHLCFHTFPERNYLSLELFACGEADLAAALDVFRQALDPDHVENTVLDRGDKLE